MGLLGATDVEDGDPTQSARGASTSVASPLSTPQVRSISGEVHQVAASD